MTSYIKSISLLAVLFLFSACNNTNQPQEEMKEVSETPTMGAKQQALADAEEMSMKNKKGVAIAGETPAKQSPAQGNTISDVKVTDENGNKIRPVPSAAPQSDADRLRQRLAEQNAPKQTVAAPAGNGNVSAPAATKTVKNSGVKSPAATEAAVTVAKPDHSVWNTILSANVSSTGKVNYRGIQAQSMKLNAYLDDLKSNPPMNDWSRNEKMAFWINAYNAFTVKKILDNYPLSSITELSGGKVWDDKWINIGSKTYSLNDIENGILRPVYKDARIHFAVNCAAKSCPPLHNRAFTADNLNGTLERLTKKFVNNGSYNTIGADQVEVSKIFEWYGDDFGSDLVKWLGKYSDANINSGAAVKFSEYDWALNE